MSQFVQQAVRETMRNPSEEATAELILGVDGSKRQVRRLVENNGGRIIEELPFDTLHVEVPEVEIETVSESVDIQSIEFDESGRVMSSGNSAPR